VRQDILGEGEGGGLQDENRFFGQPKHFPEECLHPPPRRLGQSSKVPSAKVLRSATKSNNANKSALGEKNIFKRLGETSVRKYFLNYFFRFLLIV